MDDVLACALEPAYVCVCVCNYFSKPPCLFSKHPCISPNPLVFLQPHHFFLQTPALFPTPPPPLPRFSNPPKPLTVLRRAGCDDDGPAPPLPLCSPCVYALLLSRSGTLSTRSFPFFCATTASASWHILQSASTGNRHIPGIAAAAPRSPGRNPQSPCAWLHLALHTPRHAPSFVPPPLHLPLSLARPSALGVHAYGELEMLW